MDSKKLAKFGFIYFVSSIVTQLISMLLVPVFTKNMSQDQFGQYNLIISYQSLLSVVAILGINSGLTRFFNEYKDKNKLKNIALTFSVIWCTLLCILVYVLKDLLSNIVFNGDPNGVKYINILIITTSLLSIISIYTVNFTMQYKAAQCSAINLIKSILLLSLSIYFVIFKKEGLGGALKSQVISYGLVTTILILYDLKNIRFVLAKKELWEMLKYGINLVPGQASAWVFTLIDRYFVQLISGLRVVAIYSMGYRIGMLMDPIFISPFKSVFTSYKYTVYKDEDANEKIRKIFVYYNFFGWLCILGFSVFSRDAILILSTTDYLEAYKIIPIILFSYFLMGLGEFYSLGIHVANKPILESIILAIGAITNIILNYLLIPVLGMYGAAYATVISYLIMNILNYIIGRKYIDIGINYFEPFKSAFIFVGLYIIFILINQLNLNIFIEVILNTSICIAYIIINVILGFLPYSAIQNIILNIRKKFNINKIKINEEIE